MRRADDPLASAPVVQLFLDTPTGRALARGLRETRTLVGMSAPVDRVIGDDEKVTSELVAAIAEEHPGAVLAAWLGADDIGALAALAGNHRPPAVFLSAPLLGDGLPRLPESVRSFCLLTHPTAFPDDKARTRAAIERWLEIRDIPLTNFEIQADMYFIGWNLAGQLKMMRDEFYRDYLLDITDMMRDQDYAVGVYERLSFGPGQRYASKGCYLAELTAGPDATLVKRSDWVVH